MERRTRFGWRPKSPLLHRGAIFLAGVAAFSAANSHPKPEWLGLLILVGVWLVTYCLVVSVVLGVKRLATNDNAPSDKRSSR